MKIFFPVVLAWCSAVQGLDVSLRSSSATSSALQHSQTAAEANSAVMEGVTLSFEVANYDYGLVLQCHADEIRKAIIESVSGTIRAAAEKTHPQLTAPFETYVQIFSGETKIVTLPANTSENATSLLASQAMLNSGRCSCSVTPSLLQVRNPTEESVSYGTRVEVFMTLTGSAVAAPAPAPDAAVPPVGILPGAPGPAISLSQRRKPATATASKAAVPHPLQAIVNDTITCGSIKKDLEVALQKATCVLPVIIEPAVGPNKVTEWDSPGCEAHMMRIAKLYAEAYTPRLVPPAILNECTNFMVKATFDRDELIEAEDRAKCRQVTAKFAQQWAHGSDPKVPLPNPPKVGGYDFGGFCKEICLVKFGPAAAQCRAFNGWR
mmetsp:Transcript_24505/g.56470  ORF Transcript_24505/g.56470 Transcript_24505/m.56470 type:complete len:379 (-) Transcript_24505:49-1185(-)